LSSEHPRKLVKTRLDESDDDESVPAEDDFIDNEIQNENSQEIDGEDIQQQ